jgi:hypothetical protein
MEHLDNCLEYDMMGVVNDHWLSLLDIKASRKDSLNAKKAFLQMSQLLYHKAYHDPWCKFIFGYVG